MHGLAITRVVVVFVLYFLDGFGSMAFALFFSFLHWFGMSDIEVLFIHPGPGPQGITTEVFRDSDKG